MNLRIFFYLFNIIILSSSCDRFQSEEELNIIAKYDHNILTKDVISLAIPKNISPEDSIVFLKHYVNQWAREKAILAHAIFNLQNEELEIDLLVENYKNALIKQRFEQNYLNKYLDTIVTTEQNEEYYIKNKNIFVLKESIIKLIYVRVSKFAPDIEELRDRMNVDYELDIDWLIDYCHLYAKRSNFETNGWIKLNDIILELPIQDFQKNKLLNKTEIIEFEDENDIYLLKIVDFAIKDQIPPLTYVKDQVHSLILHKRKKKLLQTLENELFEKSLREGKFEFY